MSQLRKILDDILRGTADKKIRFRDLRRILAALEFEERIRGDHHIYTREDVVEIINIQPKGTLAKPYQVKQVRQLILKYRLGNIV
jgi:hypothetical protein